VCGSSIVDAGSMPPVHAKISAKTTRQNFHRS
jgi:hypothetical protein